VRRGSRLGLTLLLVLLGLETGTVRANTFLQMQSTYLGDGWFQYRMQVQNDPFFSQAEVTSLSIDFTNRIDYNVNAERWTNSDFDTIWSSWSFIADFPSRPYEETFLVRSSETTYKIATWSTNLDGTFNAAGCVVCMSLYLSDLHPDYPAGGTYSQNIVGYAFMPCLVPCRPEEADGSPTNFVYDLKLLPDILIDHLVQTDGIYNGVDFIWGYESTFLLQGTTDFKTWTNVDYIWSYPPETTWNTDKSLGNYGQFFRLAMVAGYHTTDLPPLNAGLARPAAKVPATIVSDPATPRVTGCRPAGARMVVNLATLPNQTCKVQAVDSHRAVLQTRQVTATGTSASVEFDAASLPSPAYFQVVAAQ
jgi:hypothetical protein